MDDHTKSSIYNRVIKEREALEEALKDYAEALGGISWSSSVESESVYNTYQYLHAFGYFPWVDFTEEEWRKIRVYGLFTEEKRDDNAHPEDI